MRQFLCSLVLFGAVGGLVAATPTSTRPKDKQKKEEKDKKSDEKDASGVIEVYQAKDGWRFRVLAADGKSIAIGLQGYAKKEDCLAAVELLKTTMAKAKVIELPKP